MLLRLMQDCDFSRLLELCQAVFDCSPPEVCSVLLRKQPPYCTIDKCYFNVLYIVAVVVHVQAWGKGVHC